jgi:hypothetical protein
MFQKGPNHTSVPLGVRLEDLLRRGELSPRPEPRLPFKHGLNPPVVTVLGAGVAGLTAAHELVERGFLVQVVEAEEDPYCPRRPLVGGMAANQPARVRGNIEDLHPQLFELMTQGLSAEEGSVDNIKGKLAQHLIELFAFNRRSWLSTEFPARVRRTFYSEPGKPVEFTQTLLLDLRAARERYRKQWIWDLCLRSVLVGDIRPRDRAAINWDKFLGLANDGYTELIQLETPKLARRLNGFGGATRFDDADVEKHLNEFLVPALEREFLCFRLVPRVTRGFEAAPETARNLLHAWCEAFEEDEKLRHCCISKKRDCAKIAVTPMRPPPELPNANAIWLELDIIEQRLPGEHGFRFFPSFYRHIEDTMRRISLFDGDRATGRTALDNLKPTVFQGIGFNKEDKKELEGKRTEVGWDNSERSFCQAEERRGPGTVVALNRDLPRSIQGLRDRTDRLVKRLGGTPKDAVLLFVKLFRFMSTSPERRRKEYEGKTWAEFLELKKFSKAMQEQINSAARVLVAFSAKEADARTYGTIALQLLFDQLKDISKVDRTLNGPTSDAWLEPWRDYLERQGVRFFCRKVLRLARDGEEVVPIFSGERNAAAPHDVYSASDPDRIVSQDGYRLLTHLEQAPGMRPDFYVLALNFERTRELVDALGPIDEKRAPDFAQLLRFSDKLPKDALKYATGVQFFFDAKTSIGEGHMYFPQSKWGLSSISQSEFWSQRGGFSDGYLGVLSVCVCSPGKNPDQPKKHSFWEVLKNGTEQVKSLQSPEANRYALVHHIWKELTERISDTDKLEEPRCFHIDQKLLPNPNLSETDQAEPLKHFPHYLASLPNVDRHRPGRKVDDELCVGEQEIKYSINYERWVLCSTFMATHTRLTTMESANESARHAVNAILRRLASDDAHQYEQEWKPIEAYDKQAEVRSLTKTNYNGSKRIYDLPDIFNPEDFELEDLDLFRRIDRRLLALELPHFLDIIDFDRKLVHALQALEIYADDAPVRKALGLLVSGLDAALLQEFGRDYRLGVDDVRKVARQFDHQLATQVLSEMKTLLGKFERL